MTIRTGLYVTYAMLMVGLLGLLAFVGLPVVFGRSAGGWVGVVAFMWPIYAIAGILRLKRQLREGADLGDKSR
jgi:hypothetical protein